MKKLLGKSRGYSLLFALLMLIACEQNIEEKKLTNPTLENKINEETVHVLKVQNMKKILQAQKFVESMLAQTRVSQNMQLNWQHAFCDSTKSYETVEVPISYKKQKCIVLTESEERHKATKDSKYLQNITRLIIETDSQTKEKRSYYMTIVPSATYIDDVPPDITSFRNFASAR